MAESSPENLLRLSAQIVSAHVSRNAVAPEALAALIRDVHAALSAVGQVAMEAAAGIRTETERPQPAVPVRRSVQPGHLVCLEDGLKMSMLKRHLAARHGMTPDQYRARWNLPAGYPMVAPEHSSRRSDLAKQFGLARSRSANGAKASEPTARSLERASTKPSSRRAERRLYDNQR